MLVRFYCRRDNNDRLYQWRGYDNVSSFPGELLSGNAIGCKFYCRAKSGHFHADFCSIVLGPYDRLLRGVLGIRH